jgi:hypothetical protein
MMLKRQAKHKSPSTACSRSFLELKPKKMSAYGELSWLGEGRRVKERILRGEEDGHIHMKTAYETQH